MFASLFVAVYLVAVEVIRIGADQNVRRSISQRRNSFDLRKYSISIGFSAGDSDCLRRILLALFHIHHFGQHLIPFFKQRVVEHDQLMAAGLLAARDLLQMEIDDGEQPLPDVGCAEFKLSLYLHLTNNKGLPNIDMFFGAVAFNKVIKNCL